MEPVTKPEALEPESEWCGGKEGYFESMYLLKNRSTSTHLLTSVCSTPTPRSNETNNKKIGFSQSMDRPWKASDYQ